MRPLRTLALVACFVVTLSELRPSMRAQSEQLTLPFDHVHVAVTDPERAADWYVRLLGARTAATPDRVWFGDVLLIFQKTAERRSGAQGAVGHVAFVTPDAAGAMTTLMLEGARVVAKSADIPGLFTAPLLEDPWGVPIEIVEGPQRGLHHVHLIAPGPADALSGYQRLFGGVRTRIGQTDALQYGSVFLLVERGESAAAPAAIDHISWRVENVDQATATLRAGGVTVLREPGISPGGNRVSFVEGPGGVRIEVMQRSR
jgi:catechol 2,3-dioxygenase-like lactoylglutathione lyase family enzyme